MSEATNGGAAGATATRFLYVADPMCSWCWGFAPVIARIAEDYGARAPIRLVAGGLRVGTTQPMDEQAKAAARHHWEQVQAATGQPFDFGFFERERFVYDTGPACRAVVAARNMAPDAGLSALHAIHHAFYAANRDVTRVDVLADVIAETGIDRETFLAVYASEEVGDSLNADFAGVQALQIAGFPALLVLDDDGAAFLTVGYRPFTSLVPLIERWLSRARAR